MLPPPPPPKVVVKPRYLRNSLGASGFVGKVRQDHGNGELFPEWRKVKWLRRMLTFMSFEQVREVPVKFKVSQDTERHCRSHCVQRQPGKGQPGRQAENASDATVSQV